MFTRIFLLLTLCFGAEALAKESVATTQPTINFRGEELPIFAPPHSIKPRRWYPPIYPDRERRDEVEGVVLVLAVVGTDGKVLEAEVVGGHPSAAFGEAANTAVLKWTFPEVLRAKKPTKYLVQVPVFFSMSKQYR